MQITAPHLGQTVHILYMEEICRLATFVDCIVSITCLKKARKYKIRGATIILQDKIFITMQILPVLVHMYGSHIPIRHTLQWKGTPQALF